MVEAALNQRGEYSERGDYHRKLDRNWRYYPIYVEKMRFVEGFLDEYPKNLKILDVGCGEGVLVEEYSKQGYDITGLDLEYQSEHVIRGDIRGTKFKDGSFDLILFLDVIEHLNYDEQETALLEIHRLLKPDGMLLASIPNLAHLSSRIIFLLTGELTRTSLIERHKGDRPVKEYKDMLEKHFTIVSRKGIFPTYPICSLLTYFFPDKVLVLHRFLNRFLAYPNWCFLNIFVCKKK
jgi:SAM-dependent methyltransferase